MLTKRWSRIPTRRWRRMPSKRWNNFFRYLARVLILLVILAVLLPKLGVVCNHWMLSRLHDEQAPIGNALRVDAPVWSKFIIQWFPATEKAQ
ncbi:MAG TPA: hypothetical protein VFC84_12675 [Desulfosporosinus sp.]|nr:hypothetical protein [Desulfosporosinus sp.]